MTNSAPITLDQLFRFYRNLPHQLAAITELEEDLKANGYQVAMNRSRPWFSVWSQAGKQQDPSWIEQALPLIKEFEGCRLQAYPDPGTGGDPWTIGYGTTRYGNGLPVRRGDVISQMQAIELLSDEVRRFGAVLANQLKRWQALAPNQQAALVSWAYNVGLGASGDSSLVRRLNAGEDPNTVARQEFPKWCRGGSGVMAGLVRRRAAEVALFCRSS